MTPFYDRDGITIYCGETIAMMAQLDILFHAIIADLPYGTTACSWDTVIPFEPLWEQYKRLTHGAVVLFGSQPFTSALVMSNLEMFQHEVIWEKNSGAAFLLAGHRPNQVHENILIFSGKNYHPNATEMATYNPDMTLSGRGVTLAETIHHREKTKHANDLSWRPRPTKMICKPKAGTYPRSVRYFPRDNTNTTFHPTQKPVALLAYLIRTYTNPGEIVLDNTMGSGTTLVAAQREGRRAVGIEISEAYCKIAVERLRQRSIFQVIQPIENKPQLVQATIAGM